MTVVQPRDHASSVDQLREIEAIRRELDLQRKRQALLQERAWRLEKVNETLEQEVEQRHLAEQLARGQSEMLIHSLSLLASAASLDNFLGHVLTATVDQLGAVGGTLWFPDRQTGTAHLHFEYVDSRVIPASQSKHPAARCPPPIGGEPTSTFPDERAEAYVLTYEVAGMPEENRAYIFSLGVRTLLTVPMVLGKETVGWFCIRSSRMDVNEMKSKVRVAEALVGQATLAVQMARLNEQVRQAAVLEERNRIARDIHDTLAQGFTGVVLNLEASSRALRKQNTELALQHIEHAQQLAQTGLAEARLSVGALRPDLQQADLVDALDTVHRRIDATGTIDSRLVVLGQRRSLPREMQVELVRIAQESVTNILKHARAHGVTLTVTFSSTLVSLSIADDGVGFDTKAHHDGFGLLGMQERAERIGARLAIHSGFRNGTEVLVSVPTACADDT